MNPTDFDDETLMAYADGELDRAAAQRVAEAEAADDALAARIAMFRQTGDLLGSLGAARPEAPVPGDLAARVEATLAAARGAPATAAPEAGSDRVVPFPVSAAPPRPRVTLALAASAALLVGAVGGVIASLAIRPDTGNGPGLALLDSPGIEDALGRLAAGERGAAGPGEVAIIASFLTRDGLFCREFEYDAPDSGTSVSVVCHEAGGWRTRFALVSSGLDDTGYAPASSLETLDTYLDAIGAGPTRSPEEEAARLSALGG